MTNELAVARLLAALASEIRRPDQRDPAGEATVTSLASSLNPPPPPQRTRVLDAALSLMCFTSREVWSWNVKFLMEAIITALSSSIACKRVHCEGEGKKVETLLVGSSVSYEDCEKLLGTFSGILQSLKDCGSSEWHFLFETITKVAISAPRYKTVSPQSSLFCKTRETAESGKILLGSKLNSCLPMGTCTDGFGVPLRLCIWYLDPLILKTDILEMLQEYSKRHFLHLKVELHERMEWRAIVRCLVTSPVMFLKVNALLQNWFLTTGMASVLALQSALVLAILDVLSRPMWWGFSMDVGLMLPSSHGYFGHNHRDLLHILSGSVSFKTFLDLVDYVKTKIPFCDDFHSGAGELRKAKHRHVDSSSTWAMLMNFPHWTYFSIMLCFCKKNGMPFAIESLSFQALNPESAIDAEMHRAAAMYLSVILSPYDQIHSTELHDHISKLSGSCLARGASYSQQCFLLEKRTHFHSKKLRKPRPSSACEKHVTFENKFSYEDIAPWLQQFHRIFTSFCGRAANSSCPETEGTGFLNTLPCQLIRKIPLGILLSDPSGLDEEGCFCLLHYAATGAILQANEIQIGISPPWDRKISGTCIGGEATEWLWGASVVFDLFDSVDDVIATLFDTETARLDYICQMKSKVVKYLVRCVAGILQVQYCNNAANEVTLLVDLRNRLLQWKRQGRESFEGCKNLDDALDNLSRKILLK